MEYNLEELDLNQYSIDNENEGVRVDKFLSNMLPDYSRVYLQDLIKEGFVLVNDKNIKPSYKLELDDVVVIYFKPIEDLTVEPENIPLDIIYEDEDIAIINKEAGMVVHPSAGHKNHTLVNALLFHIKDLSGINGKFRPGIVHRIDMDTSGLVAIAKNDIAHKALAEQLKDHSMARTYKCIVTGVLESKKGLIKTLIGRDKKNRLKMAVVNDGGKEAITEFEVERKINDRFSLVNCHLQTGRTHQIRVHMAFIKHPIVNDPLYGENNKIDYDCKQLLHAYELTLIHPRTKEKMTFNAPLPKYFTEVLKLIENK